MCFQIYSRLSNFMRTPMKKARSSPIDKMEKEQAASQKVYTKGLLLHSQVV
jgi:hypothetical protein